MSDMTHTNQITPLAYSPPQAAALMGFCKTKVFELLKQKKLKSFKYGSRRLIRLEAIEACLVLLEQEGQ